MNFTVIRERSVYPRTLSKCKCQQWFHKNMVTDLFGKPISWNEDILEALTESVSCQSKKWLKNRHNA